MGNCLRCRTEDQPLEGDSVDDVRRDGRDYLRNNLSSYYENDPIMYPAPGISRPMSQLTEEEQVKIATRMGLIATLPLFKFDEDKREKLSECIICMCEYEIGEELRYLPCLHTYHRVCIDDWLMRALTCPSCLEEIRPTTSPRGTRSADSVRSGDRPPTDTPDPGTASGPPPYHAIAPDSSYGGDSASLTVTTASNNNRSAGDGLMNVSSRVATGFPARGGQHRRTRSNGHVPLRPSGVDVGPSGPERRRRGNSLSDLPTSHNPSPNHHHVRRGGQLDGDSH